MQFLRLFLQACLQHCLENVTLSLCDCRIGYVLTEMDYFSGNGDTLNETLQGCSRPEGTVKLHLYIAFCL